MSSHNDRAAGGATEALPSLAGIDVQAALGRLNGDEALYRNLLDRFRQGQVDVVAKIRAALASGDRKTAHRLSHTLKGVAGTIGASAVQHAARQLESAIDESQTNVATLLLQLETQLSATLATLDASMPAATQPGSPTNVAAAPELLRSRFAELRTTLRGYDARAVDVLAEIRSRLTPAQSSQAIQELSGFIASYDFDAALECLDAVEKALGIGGHAYETETSSRAGPDE